MKKVLYTSQINEVSSYVDKAVIDYINEGQIETFESFPNFNIVAFDWYDIYDIEAEPSQIMVYLDKDDIFFLCENELAFNKASSVFRDFGTNERTLYDFFRSLLRDDTKNIESLEEKITDAEDALITGAINECASDIVEFRRELLRLRKYYEQLDSIFDELQENDNRLLSDEGIRYFAILGSRTDKLLAGAVTLREYVAQVREAYQAQIDITQNNLMKVFTVVTSIFLPLTLIVGWYGMNFNMPEFSWKYGYAAVIGLSVVVCAVWAIIFKKKKWM